MGYKSFVFILGCLVAAGCSQKHVGAIQPTSQSLGRPVAYNAAQTGTAFQNNLEREVRHQLVMLPYYSVFDDLAYRVEGGTVYLSGAVTDPTVKNDAGNVVKSIEGVQQVVNDIKVLPPSSMDDRIRIAEYRAIYGQPVLNRYALQAVPPIHIIVDNGKVTLTGVVASQSDKNVANIQANSVPGVFSVTNDLRVQP